MKCAKILAAILAIALMISFAGVATASDQVTVTGVLEDVDGVLTVDTYQLEGEVDEALIGKTVEVTGTVIEQEGAKVLQVAEIKPVE